MPTDFYPISALNVAERGGEFVLCFRETPLLTAEKHPVAGTNRALIEFILKDFVDLGVERIKVTDDILVEPNVLSAYQLFANQVDYIAPGIGPTPEEYRKWLSDDPVLADVPPAGVLVPVQSFLASLGLALVPLSSPGGNRLLNNLVDVCRELAPEKQSVVVNLLNKYGNNVLFALALVSGFCSAENYSVGVCATEERFHAFFDIESQTEDLHNLAEVTDFIKAVRGDADACLKYIQFYV